ncbi:lipopolysaccharide biosynthesis protein [Salarchaeum japonicum]|uniref:lipopolysaccharide biosynthesis protein n=1 Tax=Salarchaeum japonicum TaxID=555573 RepID=UPI003C76FCB1
MSAGEADFGFEISKGVIAKFLMGAIGFAGSVVFARVLGPAGYGAFYVVLTLVDVLDNPVTGWGMACKKRLTEVDFPLGEALGSSLLGALLFPIVILPAAYLLHRSTELYDLSGLFVPFSVLFVTLCLFVVSTQILSARANFSAVQWADTLRSIFTTPLQLAFVLLGFGAAGMVYGLAVATALTVPYVLYRIDVHPVLPTRSSVFRIASYAKYSVPNGFIGTTQSRIDILLLGALLTSASVGKYQVAMQLTLAGTFIGEVTSTGLMARVSEYWSRDDVSATSNDVANALGFASILAIPLFFGAAAMPNDLLVAVFGPQYGGVGIVLVGIAFFRVVNMQSIQLGSTVAGLDRPDLNTRIGLVGLVLNVGLGYLLLLEFGIAGVVAATIVSELVKYLILEYVVKQYLPEVPLLTRPLRHQLLSGAIMFAVVDGLHSLMFVSWWGDLVVLVGVGAAVYSVTLTAISEPVRTTARGILSDALDR